MSPDTLIYFAIAVFTLMVIGLALTILEFRKGGTRKQAEQPLPPDLPRR